MTIAVESAKPELLAVAGGAHVVSDPETCAAFAIDGLTPKYVVYPTSAEHVAALLKWASDHDLAVIPCRNGTKLGVGNSPERYDIALSLKAMNNVWHYEPADLTIGVEPGVKFADFQNFVSRHNLWLPLDPPHAARASLGGVLATNSAGPLRLRYGAPRDMVLGMKIATSEGKIIKTGARVVKNVAGYDFSKLLIGSYGTLGVIVEANLKLYPVPAERSTLVLRLSSLGNARDLRRKILGSPLQPMRMVLLNSTAAAFVRACSSSAPGRSKALELWIEVGGSQRVIERYAREFASLGREAGASLDSLEAGTSESHWARIADFATAISESCPSPLILKAVLPIRNCEEFLSEVDEESPGEKKPTSVSQVGVGIVHVCFTEEMSPAGVLSLVERLRKVAEKLRGTLIVENCSSELKTSLDVWGTPGDNIELMRKVKNAWDPKGVLAPGRLIGSI